MDFRDRAIVARIVALIVAAALHIKSSSNYNPPMTTSVTNDADKYSSWLQN